MNTPIPDERRPPAPTGCARRSGDGPRARAVRLVCAGLLAALAAVPGARAQVVIGGTGSEPTSSDSVIIDRGVLDALRGGSSGAGASAPHRAAPAPAPAPRASAPAPVARSAPFVPPAPGHRPARSVVAAPAAPTPSATPAEPAPDAVADLPAEPATELPELDTSAAAPPVVEPPRIPAPRPPPPRPVVEQAPIETPPPADVAPDPPPPDPPIVAERPPAGGGADDAPPAGRRVETPAPPAADAPEAAPAPDRRQTAALPPPGESVTTLPDNQGFRIVFDEETSAFTDSAGRLLTGLAQRMTEEPDMRLQVRAYAGGTAEGASRARRLSLDRALAVRTFLLDRGVEATRIDVRALGNTAPEPPSDRVDLLVSG